MKQTLSSYIKGLDNDGLYDLFYVVLKEMNDRKELERAKDKKEKDDGKQKV